MFMNIVLARKRKWGTYIFNIQFMDKTKLNCTTTFNFDANNLHKKYNNITHNENFI